MYITARKRISRKDSSYSYYFYLCESKRVDGKVKNTQRYLLKLPEWSIIDDFCIKIYALKLNWLSYKDKYKVLELLEDKFFNIRIIELELKNGTKFTDEQKKQMKDNKGNSKNYNYNYDFGNFSNSNNCNYNKKLLTELVKLGYWQLSKKYHPDASGGDQEKMKELNMVHDFLKSEFKL
jgi:hypothetical protein